MGSKALITALCRGNSCCELMGVERPPCESPICLLPTPPQWLPAPSPLPPLSPRPHLLNDCIQLVHLRLVQALAVMMYTRAVHHALVKEQAVHRVAGVVVLLNVPAAACAAAQQRFITTQRNVINFTPARGLFPPPSPSAPPNDLLGLP